MNRFTGTAEELFMADSRIFENISYTHCVSVVLILKNRHTTDSCIQNRESWYFFDIALMRGGENIKGGGLGGGKIHRKIATWIGIDLEMFRGARLDMC